MSIEDMFTMKTDPIHEWVKEVTKRAELELAYFILTRNDYELANYDVRQITEHEEYRTALWFGFNFETTRRITPRTDGDICKIREMAVEVLRRNERNATLL